MVHHNQAKLADKLRELFNIKSDREGVQGVFTRDDTYSSVILEISEFTFGDFEMKQLFAAKEFSGAKGFYMTPRMERESKARHYILFYF